LTGPNTKVGIPIGRIPQGGIPIGRIPQGGIPIGRIPQGGDTDREDTKVATRTVTGDIGPNRETAPIGAPLQ